MAKAKRLYQKHWELLKAHGTITVMTTNSDDPKIQKNLIRAIRRAIQKEKYLDVAFRAVYVAAALKCDIHANNKGVEFTLDKGVSCDATTTSLFGEETTKDNL